MNNHQPFEMVVKSNELIQKSRFSLSANQQKIILYLISKIKYSDEDFEEYEIKIKDFCEICGIDATQGTAYKDMKENIKKISDKSMWIEIENRETLVRWIEKPTIYKQSGVIKIKFDKDLKPYLLNLKQQYTQFELIYTLQMKSKYSIRLYEILKSKHFNSLKEYNAIFKVDRLKYLLSAENYTQYKEFNRTVLKKAIEEINKYSDINVTYNTIREGRNISKINFSIKLKDLKNRLSIAVDYENLTDKKDWYKWK